MSNVVIELRDLDEARLFLLQGLWLQRVVPPVGNNFHEALGWALEMASEGLVLPPIGFIADLGHVAFGLDWESRNKAEARPVPGLPQGLIRTYEDYVLGKVYSDWTFARASDVLRRYQGRDRARGLAFLINQFRLRANFGGLDLFNPAVIKSVLETPPDDALAQGWESLNRDGLLPVLEDLYEGLIAASRRMAEVLAPEDVFHLEHGLALKDLSERLALDQVLKQSRRMEDALPHQRIKPLAGRQEVPTRVLDEDTYPVGGFTSLSNRGTIESLVRSELAYMETAKEARPDLFDIRFLLDELLYYSRDDNQFLRRRRTFALVLSSDLIHARVKDAGLPYQRGILLWALLHVTVFKLIEWLSTDALKFIFYFLEDADGEPALVTEREMFETLFREQIANGTVEIVEKATLQRAEQECSLKARRSLCHCLLVSTGEMEMHPQDSVVSRLVIAGPRPAIGGVHEKLLTPEGDDPMESWQATLEQLLQRWI
jgi:hypothetical protein